MKLSSDCPLCPRLADFRQENRRAFPDWFNAPVPSFGAKDTELLIVGLAPGLKGANRTGRPFTGDYAGDLLYETLREYGLAKGIYAGRPDDGLQLVNCRITNAAHCVPPQNKPLPVEVKTCNRFLREEIKGMKNLKIVLALGTIAHHAVLMALDEKKAAFRFAHGADFNLTRHGLRLVCSFHCSRYNTQTNRLTSQMFSAIFQKITQELSTTRQSG